MGVLSMSYNSSSHLYAPQQMNEGDSILFCLTESQYCLESGGAKADFSTPFLG